MQPEIPQRSGSATTHVPAARREFPLVLALILVGTILGGLLVGYEPTGGDPDRMYRPLKTELSRALREARLPFWSERFGLGVPLVAESHVAAFYPPNLLLYRLLDVSTAYRISMWLHYVALVATTYFLGRSLGIASWGSALGAVAFALCGFQTIHSSHEPFFLLMPYLPLALAIAERFLATGRACWLALLALALGLQWSLGHFQIQMWTSGLVVLFGLWHAAFDRSQWKRAIGTLVAAGLGMTLAAVQLGLSWQFASLVNQTERSVAELSFYSFPPAHWFELALPRPVRELRLGAEDPYWFGERTTGFEAACYIGTIPLIFAIAGYCRRPAGRSALLWRLIAPLGFALATMPRWWPEGYAHLLNLPGLGYFRVPARYTLLASLGLTLIAGEGFDRAISAARFRLGVFASLIFAGSAAIAAWRWSRSPDVHLAATLNGIAGGIGWGALAWLVAMVLIVAWRTRRLESWAPLAAAAIELGILFHLGTTHWGWSIHLPSQSQVLSELARERKLGLIGGEIENLPLWIGAATADPYLGFTHPDINKALVALQKRLLSPESGAAPGQSGLSILKRWLRRCQVTHLVGRAPAQTSLGEELGRWRDSALDRILYRRPDEPMARVWSIVRLDEPFPEVYVAARAESTPDRRTLMDRLSFFDDLDRAWFLAEDRVPTRPPARMCRLVSWDGRTATVEHDGTCDLIVARTFDPGWQARIDGGPDQPVVRVNGGLLAVRLQGAGSKRVAFQYRPPRIVLWATISL
ncbi:MAG TPA: hypothetical protein VKA15_20110, partial [Isosphaeraceae bacterium]|nr:hypothetical protein [Isosphaeraceae bacterium]